MASESLQNGLYTIKPEPAVIERPPKDKKVCILSSGYMLGRAIDVAEKLLSAGYEVGIVDLWRVKPINSELFVFKSQIKNPCTKFSEWFCCIKLPGYAIVFSLFKYCFL